MSRRGGGPLRAIGQDVDPSRVRSTIPRAQTLATNRPPFSGELREEQSLALPALVFAGAGPITIRQRAVVVLRRPWPVVGAGVGLGDQAGVAGFQVVALIFAIGRFGRYVIGSRTIVAPVTDALAVAPMLAGVRCELDLVWTSPAAATLHNATVAIWAADMFMPQG